MREKPNLSEYPHLLWTISLFIIISTISFFNTSIHCYLLCSKHNRSSYWLYCCTTYPKTIWSLPYQVWFKTSTMERICQVHLLVLWELQLMVSSASAQQPPSVIFRWFVTAILEEYKKCQHLFKSEDPAPPFTTNTVPWISISEYRNEKGTQFSEHPFLFQNNLNLITIPYNLITTLYSLHTVIDLLHLTCISAYWSYAKKMFP